MEYRYSVSPKGFLGNGLFFIGLVVHELGHLIVLKHLGFRVRNIRFSKKLGGVIVIDFVIPECVEFNEDGVWVDTGKILGIAYACVAGAIFELWFYYFIFFFGFIDEIVFALFLFVSIYSLLADIKISINTFFENLEKVMNEEESADDSQQES